MKLQHGKSVERIALPKSAIPVNVKTKRISRNIDEKNLSYEDEANEILEDNEHSKDLDTYEDTEAVECEYISCGEDCVKHNIYNHEKLYKEVWESSVVKVAEKYGVSDVAIHKICKKLNIPTPPLRYWTKINAGVKVPKTNGPTQIIGAKTIIGAENKTSEHAKQPLWFLPNNEREKVLLAAGEIELSAVNVYLHKKIVAYKNVVRDWNQKDNKANGAQRKIDYYYNPPFLAGVISGDLLPRVYRILDALFRQIEKLGGSINDDLSLRIRNEIVRIEIVESQDKIDHVITQQEAQELIRYRDEKQRYSWSSAPKIRKYDYVFNGKLRISIRNSRYFRDTDKINIESRLGEILIEIYETSEVVRLEREEKEAEARRKAEAERLKEERRKRYNKEVELALALENSALDYDNACKIRAYIKTVANSHAPDGLDEATVAWIEWATKKADWLDPIVAREDELFGKREHEKDVSEKTLRKYGPHW